MHLGRQVPQVPGMLPYLRNADAAVGVRHKDAAQQVAALGRQRHVSWDSVLHRSDALHAWQGRMAGHAECKHTFFMHTGMGVRQPAQSHAQGT